MRRGPGPLYRNIHPDHAGIVAELEERFAHLRLRMDSGFVGSVPVQCTGRIGRRYFYFRFRGDCASLTVGSADLHGDASRAKHARRRALRALRRGTDQDGLFGDRFFRRDLKQDKGLGRHPSRAAWYAVRNDVTGEQWAGALEQEEAAELFSELLNDLKPARPNLYARRFKAHPFGNSPRPINHPPGIIRKPSKARR